MIENNDTIAAICTGMTGSGINIIRISGSSAFEIAEKIFKSISNKHISDMGNFSVNYGYIVDDIEEKKPDIDTFIDKLVTKNTDEPLIKDQLKESELDEKRIVDEVLLLKMKAPRSYTREDVIEIDCHGGILVTKRILEVILKNGARLAEPGEFTKRAYLNGRIDLSQAEAVIDIINSKSNLALKNSVRQLKGQIKEKIIKLRDKLISKTAYIEAALDDPEHISLEGFSDELSTDIYYIRKELEKLISSFDDGRILNEGINTCILGLPNAGKSSLLNALLDEDRAIVTDIAGTTRDVLKETVSFGDVVLNIIDTAGIRDTKDIIEKIGVDKAKKEAENADLILYVVDMNIGLTEKDNEILKELEDKKIIVVYNKSDIALDISDKITSIDSRNFDYSSSMKNDIGFENIVISSLTHSGIDELKEMIKKLFYSGRINQNENIIITNERHKELLVSAKNSIDNVISGIESEMSEDFLTIDMMDAYAALGKIIGESVEDDLADRIFKDFCMGK